MCSQTVNPIVEIESMKCPICQSGFVEETSSAPANGSPVDVGGLDSDRALSLWAPVLLGVMANPLRRHLGRRLEAEDDDHGPNPNDAEQELEALIARRRRSSAAILQLLQGIRAGIMLESANLEADNQQQQREGGGGENDGDGERERERERDEQQQRMILINPFNQTIIVQGGGSSDPNNRGTLGDYFIGPGLELLMQHLAENDPNRYGTPPAQKEAVEALHTVKVGEAMQLQCAVCLEECDVGDEVKEMPCKHKFHSSCIVTWLELHSTCPVCRYQLPADESKLSSNTQSASGENATRFSLPLLWPFSTLFSSSSSQPSPRNENGNSSLALSSGSSSTDAPSDDN